MELLLVIDTKKIFSKNYNCCNSIFWICKKDRKLHQEHLYQQGAANLISNAGATRVVTIDLHAGQIQGFFDMPEQLVYSSIIYKNIKKLGNKKLICVSPDVGEVAERSLATRLKLTLQ